MLVGNVTDEAAEPKFVMILKDERIEKNKTWLAHEARNKLGALPIYCKLYPVLTREQRR